MNHNNKQLKTVPVPHRLFESMIEAYQKWERFSDEFEDFLLAHNEKFIGRMKKARKEHLRGRIRNLKVLKQGLK